MSQEEILETPEVHFWNACREGVIGIVQELAQKVDVNWVHPIYSNTGFEIACQDGCSSIVRYLLTLPQVQVEVVRPNHWSPLQLACIHRHREVVKLLIQSPRINPNFHIPGIGTALCVACFGDRYDMARLVLASSQDIDMHLKCAQCTAQDFATFKQNTRLLRLLHDYAQDPWRVRKRLQWELLVTPSAAIFSLCIFLCDDFITM